METPELLRATVSYRCFGVVLHVDGARRRWLRDVCVDARAEPGSPWTMEGCDGESFAGVDEIECVTVQAGAFSGPGDDMRPGVLVLPERREADGWPVELAQFDARGAAPRSA
jgi:hypothetical protein